jgi:hypothetical protein
MTSLIVRYGIVAGLLVATPMLWRMLTVEEVQPGENPLGNMLLGYLIMVLALTAVFLGVKRYRDKVLGGAIRFLPALGVGVGISVVACLLYVLAWEISLANSSFDFIAYFKDSMIESARAKGLPPAELGNAIAEAESFATMYSNRLYRMPITFIEMFPVGLLVSLISAAVLRNSRVLPARGSPSGS